MTTYQLEQMLKDFASWALLPNQLGYRRINLLPPSPPGAIQPGTILNDDIALKFDGYLREFKKEYPTDYQFIKDYYLDKKSLRAISKHRSMTYYKVRLRLDIALVTLQRFLDFEQI